MLRSGMGQRAVAAGGAAPAKSRKHEIIVPLLLSPHPPAQPCCCFLQAGSTVMVCSLLPDGERQGVLFVS